MVSNFFRQSRSCSLECGFGIAKYSTNTHWHLVLTAQEAVSRLLPKSICSLRFESSLLLLPGSAFCSSDSTNCQLSKCHMPPLHAFLPRDCTSAEQGVAATRTFSRFFRMGHPFLGTAPDRCNLCLEVRGDT